MNTESKIEIRYVPSIRLRARRVNEQSIAERAVARARKLGVPTFVVGHGGTVANSYGYRAETECCVAIATPDGRCVVWVDRIPANKATLSGACSAAPRYLAELLRVREDDRYSVETWNLTRHFAQRVIAAECGA